MKIAMLSTGMEMGGAEQQLLALSEGLRARGHEVSITSLLPLGCLGQVAQRRGIPTLSLEMHPGIPDPRALWRFTRWLHRWQPQILHSHLVHANLFARLSRLLYRCPVTISTVHTVAVGGKWQILGYRLTDPLCNRTTLVCHTGAERYRSTGAVPAGKLQVVPNGIDTDQFSPDPSARNRIRRELHLGERFTWLAVGRFEPPKDYPTMLQAFAGVLQTRQDSLLLIAGQGSLADATITLAGQLGIEQHIRFLGVRDDIPNLMNAADGYVMSSAWEGLPMVLLEAAAIELPIVATDVGDVRDMLLDGKSGLLVAKQDPAALGTAMLQVMALPASIRRQMGQEGRAFTQARYQLAHILDRWEELYLELLQRKGVQHENHLLHHSSG